MTGINSYLCSDVEQIIKIRDKFIRDLEKEKNHKDVKNKPELIDTYDYFIDELMERFYVNDYE